MRTQRMPDYLECERLIVSSGVFAKWAHESLDLGELDKADEFLRQSIAQLKAAKRALKRVKKHTRRSNAQ